MKRSYPTNIDGQIFYIDEDAFILLQNYLQELRNTFSGTEGAEIVGDIESRIRELFAEKIDRGAAVIVIEDVNTVIATMGRPEELTDDSDEPRRQCHSEERECTNDSASRPLFSLPTHRKLYRNMQNKVFGGVFGGLGCYLGWNANIMRILFAVLTCLTYFWPCVLIYLVLWMIVPPAVTPRQILQMNGDPVNVDTVGQTVIATTETGTTPPPINANEDGNFIKMFFRASAKIIMGFIGVLAGIVDFVLIVAFIAGLIGSIAWLVFNNPIIFQGIGIFNHPHFFLGATMAMTWIAVGIIAFSALVWTSLCFLSDTKPASRPVVITTLIIEMLLIATGIVLSISVNAL